MFTNLTDAIKEGFRILLEPINIIKEKLIDFIDWFKDFFSFEKLKTLFTDLFKFLFVPKDSFFTKEFEEIKFLFSKKIGIEYVESMFNQLKNASPFRIDDLYYKDIKILDMKFLDVAIPRIKVYTDGFFWFLLMLYNYNQMYFLIRGTYPIKIGKGGED